MRIVSNIGRPYGRRTVQLAAVGLFCAALSGFSPAHASSTPQCAPLTHADAAALFDRWNAALIENNVMQLVGLYRDDAELATYAEDVPHRGRQAIRAYYESLLHRHPQVSVTSRTVETGCNVATERGVIVYRVTGKRKGTHMLLGGRYITQYRFEDGAWRIDRHLLGAHPIAALAPI